MAPWGRDVERSVAEGGSDRSRERSGQALGNKMLENAVPVTKIKGFVACRRAAPGVPWSASEVLWGTPGAPWVLLGRARRVLGALLGTLGGVFERALANYMIPRKRFRALAIPRGPKCVYPRTCAQNQELGNQSDLQELGSGQSVFVR